MSLTTTSTSLPKQISSRALSETALNFLTIHTADVGKKYSTAKLQPTAFPNLVVVPAEKSPRHRAATEAAIAIA
ncbi:hypothetical protein H6G17_32110 [Chroococcidiopsis sp. FACHB-1243]|uniref:hypothetical protein n=1 Tax=Chroococcidiopsis sp. [FACHB-1243] TaxID=2692781 RepID=UPI0017831620|nr:hypothetical protein [Chroococcidiopsis sp. [FACHB-1243]]MBD2310038.1 hypothetical protein [Chroococcidiopsis sp. [FACHB-1243]]